MVYPRFAARRGESPCHDQIDAGLRMGALTPAQAVQIAVGGGVLYASFNPAPRLPRNSPPLAVSMKADLASLSVGLT